ncbi:MAG TPA: type II toxin-antitoxin system RatA family toxin [Thiobacillaceae bacterium]|nr:type II toxin-antitoxin system RatA family toxin [Thiobacillaceae bacterium]
MTEVVKTLLVPYTPDEMFRLVDLVEEYPDFLPWCGGSVVHQRTEELTEASLHISYMQVKQQFTTLNAKSAPEEMIIRLKSGPFRSMEGYWRFKPLGDVACKIEFALRYEFTNKLFEKVLGPVFGYIANNLVDAFIERAEKVYGAR